MGDQIRIQQGELPWQPTEDSVLNRVLHRYDRPLAGVVTQQGHDFLFACLEGQVDEWSLWAYTLLGHEDAPTEDQGIGGCVKALETSENPVTLVMCHDGEGIVESALLHKTGDSSFLEAAMSSLARGAEAVRELLALR